jgi:hypothetical protein
MKITRFVASEDGGSRFEDIEISLHNEREGAGGYTLMASEMFTSENVCFIVLPEDLDQDWHQAPTRQLVHVMSGSVEVTTTDGESRRWQAGDLFIAGDDSGRGHQTRVIDGPALVLFIPLPADSFL